MILGGPSVKPFGSRVALRVAIAPPFAKRVDQRPHAVLSRERPPRGRRAHGPELRAPGAGGLFRVRTVEAAAAALDEIAGDYERHSRAARALVEEHFDAEQILTRILERACG